MSCLGNLIIFSLLEYAFFSVFPTCPNSAHLLLQRSFNLNLAAQRRAEPVLDLAGRVALSEQIHQLGEC